MFSNLLKALTAGPSHRIGEYNVTTIRPLAEGGFSFVDLVQDTQTGKKYALKRMLCQTNEQLKAAEFEISIHDSIECPYVMQLLASSIHDAPKRDGVKEALLLFPLYPYGSLFDLYQLYLPSPVEDSSPSSATLNVLSHSLSLSRLGIGDKEDAKEKKRLKEKKAAAVAAAKLKRNGWPFTEDEALRFFLQVCAGVDAIHKRGLAHRDIKPHNVLLNYLDSPSPTFPSSPVLSSSTPIPTPSTPATLIPPLNQIPTPVIIDLGSCSPLSTTINTRAEALSLQDQASIISTSSYRAPELHDVKANVPIDGRADVWSLGCLLYFMAVGSSPFENESGVAVLAIIGGEVRFPNWLNPTYIDYLFPPVVIKKERVKRMSSTLIPPAEETPLHNWSSVTIDLIRECLCASVDKRPQLLELMLRTSQIIEMTDDQRKQREREIEKEKKTKEQTAKEEEEKKTEDAIAEDWASFDSEPADAGGTGSGGSGPNSPTNDTVNINTKAVSGSAEKKKSGKKKSKEKEKEKGNVKSNSPTLPNGKSKGAIDSVTSGIADALFADDPPANDEFEEFVGKSAEGPAEEMKEKKEKKKKKKAEKEDVDLVRAFPPEVEDDFSDFQSA